MPIVLVGSLYSRPNNMNVVYEVEAFSKPDLFQRLKLIEDSSLTTILHLSALDNISTVLLYDTFDSYAASLIVDL